MTILIRKGLIALNFDDIYREYYHKILNYCYLKLNNRELAEDCTQEVFVALAKKMHTLRLDTHVGAWLYKAAKMEVLRCYKKLKNDISLDELEDIPQENNDQQGVFEDIHTDDEYNTLTEYYVNGEDVKKMSEDRNLSTSAMYQRIQRIKQKIIQSSDKLHNLLRG